MYKYAYYNILLRKALYQRIVTRTYDVDLAPIENTWQFKSESPWALDNWAN